MYGLDIDRERHRVDISAGYDAMELERPRVLT